jgi:translation initiation factor IF-2
VLVAGGVVAFSVLVLAAVIFLKPFGAPAAAPTNTAPANVLAVADTNAPGAQRSVVPTATPPANAAAQPPAAPTPAQPAPSPTVATASPPPAPAAPPATTPARLSPGECRTSDPTGTPLNVRGRPGGEIVGALDDGIVVRVIDHRQGVQGRLWAMVEPVNHAGQSGWVFENFLNCPGGDPGAAEATRADQTARGPEPQPERPFGPRAGPGGRFRRGMGGGPG